MKTDLNKILFYTVCALLAASLILNIKGCNRESFEKLQEKNLALERTRDSLRYVNQGLKREFIEIQSAIDERTARIADLQAQKEAARKEAATYKGLADKAARDLAETNQKIEDLKKNPIKREDDNLIDSFRKKLNKP